MPIYDLTDDAIHAVPPSTFRELKIRERSDLQRILRDNIDVLFRQDEDVLVLTEEFQNWSGSSRRIDLLAVDSLARLIVVELKITEDGGHGELQAIRYAAMVETMTWAQAVDAHEAYRTVRGLPPGAEQALLDFFDAATPDDVDFGNDVRIVLASHDFSPEITTAALWLNSRGIDVRCVRMIPYDDTNAIGKQRVLLDVQQIIPLPEAEEYQVRVRKKEADERQRDQSSMRERTRSFWTGLLKKAAAVSDLHATVTPPARSSCFVRRNRFHFAYAIGRGECRVAVGINRKTEEDAQADFEAILRHKDEIEARFGEPLVWEPTDGRQRAGIISPITEPDYWDRQRWPELQDEMVDRMTRLYAAVQPVIDKMN